MTIPAITAPGRIAEAVAQTHLPQAPPRRTPPVAAETPAIRPPAKPAVAVNAAARSKAERVQELESELAEANLKLADDGHEVRFEYDRSASRLIVRLIDVGTQKVLRQYPTDEALRVARQVKLGKPLISLQA